MDIPGSEKLVVRHFFHPVGAGRFPEGTPGVVQGRAGSRKQGVAVQLQCRLEAGRILEARFLAWGCPHSIAGASWMAGELAGKTIEQAQDISAMVLADALEVPANKLGSILVLEDALARCLENARQCHYLE